MALNFAARHYAILATLNPAQTDYFYYVHSHYAKTNPEHLQNVRNTD